MKKIGPRGDARPKFYYVDPPLKIITRRTDPGFLVEMGPALRRGLELTKYIF